MDTLQICWQFVCSWVSQLLRWLIGEPSSSAPHSSSPSVFNHTPRTVISDVVYEIHKPVIGSPKFEIIFFHGFELDGHSKDSWWRDWTTADGKSCWLETWLVEEFPEARVLSVAYDSSLSKTAKTGRMDLYLLAENLTKSLIVLAKIGQQNCPVFLVGHSLGGLVMKSVCVKAASIVHTPDSTALSLAMESFLSNMRGFLFYATPQTGCKVTGMKSNSRDGMLASVLRVFDENLSHLTEDFNALSTRRKWSMRAVGESNETRLGNYLGMVVPHASARQGMGWDYLPVAQDHGSICKPADKKSESFMVLTDFVKTVMNKVTIDNLQELPKHQIDLGWRIDKVKKILQNAQRVAIIGMGGSGKTTLAKMLFNSICKNYEYTCFFENVKIRMTLEQPLTERILDNMYCQGKKVSNLKWRELEGKKVLLILDDVDTNDQVLELGDFDPGSRLIVTSRENAPFLRDFEINEVELLDYDNSRSLLCKYAFKVEEEIPTDRAFQKLLQNVVRKCDGLPLLLEAVGSFLYKTEDTLLWKDTLARLKNCESPSGSAQDKILAKLRISFDALGPVEKEMFLDVAFFTRSDIYHTMSMWTLGRWTLGRPLLDDLKLYWNGVHTSATAGWRNLKDRSLVKETKNNKIWMHERFRDLCHKIACPTDNPESHLRMDSKGFDDILMDSSNQGECRAKATALVYECRGRQNGSLDTRQFSKFSGLRFLQLNRVSLLGDPADFLRKLVVLRVSDCRLPFSLIQSCFDNLVSLHLRHWTFSGTMGHLPAASNLRDLWIERPYDRGDFDLSGFLRYLPALEHLTIGASWDTPGSAPWPEVEQLPAIASMKDLRSVSVSRCIGLVELPSFSTPLQSRLETLQIADCDRLETLPIASGIPASLKELKIIRCPRIDLLPDGVGDGLQLQHLTIDLCHEIESLPESFGRFTHLKSLYIHHCPKFVMFPESLGQLKELQYFDLKDCSELSTLSKSFGQLKQLRTFDLGGCLKLSMLPESFGQLKKLRTFRLEGCPELSTLPKSFGHLNKLRTFDLGGCLKLSTLPESFGQLKKLRTFDLRDCPKLLTLPESFGQLKELWRFRLGDCPKLSTLPESFGQLKKFCIFALWDCPKLSMLPESFGELKELRKFQLKDCPKLSTLPKSFEQLKELRTFDLRGCPKLSTLPDPFGQLKELRTFHLENCPKLSTLPESFGQLKKLRTFDVGGCPKLSALPESFGQLKKLRTFDLHYCPKLSTLPKSFGQLKKLDTFYLHNCLKLSTLPESFGQLKELCTFQLGDCPKLLTLPESFGQLKKLHTFYLHHCSKLLTLPESFGQLKELRKFDLQDCTELSTLPEFFGQLKDLEDCSKLSTVLESFSTTEGASHI